MDRFYTQHAEPPLELPYSFYDFKRAKLEVIAGLNRLLPGLWDGANNAAATAYRNGVGAGIEERAMLWRPTGAIHLDATIGPAQGERLTMASIAANPRTKHIEVKASGRKHNFTAGSWEENLQSALDFVGAELRAKVEAYGKLGTAPAAEIPAVR